MPKIPASTINHSPARRFAPCIHGADRDPHTALPLCPSPSPAKDPMKIYAGTIGIGIHIRPRAAAPAAEAKMPDPGLTKRQVGSAPFIKDLRKGEQSSLSRSPR